MADLNLPLTGVAAAVSVGGVVLKAPDWRPTTVSIEPERVYVTTAPQPPRAIQVLT